MTTRTPAAIFEEILDAWDDERRADILGALPGNPRDTEMDRHLAQVRAYREEFRKAEDREHEFLLVAARLAVRGVAPAGPGDPPFDRPLPTADEVYGILSPAHPLSGGAGFDEDGSEAAEIRPAPWARCSNCGEWIHPFQAHFPCNERPDERGERLAERYTKADGSAK